MAEIKEKLLKYSKGMYDINVIRNNHQCCYWYKDVIKIKTCTQWNQINGLKLNG